jgi:hypothetical protein
MSLVQVDLATPECPTSSKATFQGQSSQLADGFRFFYLNPNWKLIVVRSFGVVV